MSLFRSKKKEQAISAFDQIPPEAQAQLIEDILSIVRTVKTWPKLVPAELHDGMGKEVSTLLRKSGLKLASAFMSGDDAIDSLSEAMRGIPLPNFIGQIIHAVKLVLASDTKGPNDGQTP